MVVSSQDAVRIGYPQTDERRILYHCRETAVFFGLQILDGLHKIVHCHVNSTASFLIPFVGVLVKDLFHIVAR